MPHSQPSTPQLTRKRARTRLLLRVLNKHQAILAKLDLAEARCYFDKISTVRRPPTVKRITDQQIGPHSTLKIRIYHAAEADASAMLYFHGGGWMLGSLESHDAVARLLCRQTGCNIISVDYRLAPEHPFPAASTDGVTALHWLLRQQSNLSTSNVYLAGDSAGGQIALYTYLQAAAADQKHVRGLLLLYPSLDPSLSSESMQLYGEGHFVTKANSQEFWKNYLKGQMLTWPLPAHQLQQLPPTLVQTADYDILKDEGRLFAEAIASAGGMSVYHTYDGTTHGLMQMPSLLNKRGIALRDMVTFLKQTRS